jgi:hypothetical protein
MNTYRKNAVWAGVFYIIATAAPIVTVAFIGFLGGSVSGEPIPDYLAQTAAQGNQVILGMMVEVIWALSVLFIPIVLFPIFRRHNEVLALGFFGLRFMESISTIIHSILLLSLLTLSREFLAAGSPEASFYQAAGSLLLAARDWTFMIGSGLVWSLSALVLNYLLYTSKLVPRWISIWGFLGAVLSIVAYFLQFFGIESNALVFLPIALQEMVFAVWLIAKGWNPSAVALGE